MIVTSQFLCEYQPGSVLNTANLMVGCTSLCECQSVNNLRGIYFGCAGAAFVAATVRLCRGLCFAGGVSKSDQHVPHRDRSQESLTELYAERGEDESVGKTQRRQLIVSKTRGAVDLLNAGQ
jgi:hypothetical protein